MQMMFKKFSPIEMNKVKKVPVLASSICLFNQNKQVLLIQRKNPPSQFKWSIPGK